MVRSSYSVFRTTGGKGRRPWCGSRKKNNRRKLGPGKGDNDSDGMVGPVRCCDSEGMRPARLLMHYSEKPERSRRCPVLRGIPRLKIFFTSGRRYTPAPPHSARRTPALRNRTETPVKRCRPAAQRLFSMPAAGVSSRKAASPAARLRGRERRYPDRIVPENRPPTAGWRLGFERLPRWSSGG